jgi:dihydroxyacetone kinase DhaKLM complex PTS-EIIA-like component DhaM
MAEAAEIIDSEEPWAMIDEAFVRGLHGYVRDMEELGRSPDTSVERVYEYQEAEKCIYVVDIGEGRLEFEAELRDSDRGSNFTLYDRGFTEGYRLAVTNVKEYVESALKSL